ncbi:MAG: radical SAM protein, partial [Chromatiaceae bacterium]|nr:radical SAM protein [Chromatiaceae bacterium]
MKQHSASARKVASIPDQSALTPVFLANMRSRFKAEVNRMTGGGMRRLLADHPDAERLSFPLAYLYAFRWLRREVPSAEYRRAVLSAFKGSKQAFLLDLFAHCSDASELVHAYIEQLSGAESSNTVQRRQLLELLVQSDQDPERLAARLLKVWEGLGLLRQSYAEAYRDLARDERNRYGDMLGPDDSERLALLDAMPEPESSAGSRFDKLGVIPAMGCPQTCRHCMFIWRPPMRDTPDPESLFRTVNSLTERLLFTGGDLTRHLDSFIRAIGSMDRIRTFAILLNGDFADDPDVADKILGEMAAAIRDRPAAWKRAQILLQVSFDELHQEVVLGRNGKLGERIPVAKIANIVERAPCYPEIQLCLVHKQNPLSFSMDLFKRGVFGRLVQELSHRGHRVRVLSSAPSPRLKRHPLDPARTGQVVKDASFVLARYPDRPILLSSSTVDGYGRASLLDEGETVKEQDLLRQVLEGKAPAGEGFDTDLMFWFNGWVTLFSAVHICLGDLYLDGIETILARCHKDPLTKALACFDLRLL